MCALVASDWNARLRSFAAAAPPSADQAMAVAPKVVTVEMVADMVCPWCYIGYNRLQAAAKRCEEDGLPLRVEVTYTPFILRRQLPKAGVDKLAIFKQKFGSEAQGRRVLAQIQDTANAEGLCFDLTGQKAGNSEDAHRLLLWARGRGKELELFEQLVQAYNCGRSWVGDHDVLVECAEKAGLDREEAAGVVADDRHSLEALEEGLGRAQRLGVSGVPFFVVGGQRALSGAVAPEEFYELFRQLAQQGE